jgi:hypothetical protein
MNRLEIQNNGTGSVSVSVVASAEGWAWLLVGFVLGAGCGFAASALLL